MRFYSSITTQADKLDVAESVAGCCGFGTTTEMFFKRFSPL